MNMIFPVELREYSPGTIGVFFPDVPEAISVGVNQTEAFEHATDALIVALSAYLDNGEPWPHPRRPRHGQLVVRVPPLAALKLAIHEGMRTQNLTLAVLAERLDMDTRHIQRLLDLHHESRLSQLEAALAVLGLRAAVDVKVVKSANNPVVSLAV
jgi:antitoxin HicB